MRSSTWEVILMSPCFSCRIRYNKMLKLWRHFVPMCVFHQCSQESCCMTEITSYVTGMQINESATCQAPPPSSYVMAAPGWQPPQQAPPRPPLLPPPPPVTSQQPPNVVMPPSQQTVLLVQPQQRPMALFPHSGNIFLFFCHSVCCNCCGNWLFSWRWRPRGWILLASADNDYSSCSP